MILAFAGGVGGAKLAAGLARVLPLGALTVAVNTGDDFEHLGLHISPDLDTVMYNLAGCHNRETGWGVAGDTWQFMQALRGLGGEDWFQLGDRDLAVHVERTRRLRAGETLSSVTWTLCEALGIRQRVVPMSDDPIRTVVDTDRGRMGFQDYFVRLRCEPVVREIHFEGAITAKASAELFKVLDSPGLRALIICPSNPYLSVAPILAVPGVVEKIRALGKPVIAVSPIVGGKAIKGPAGKLMQELGHEVSALSVARHYRGIVDTLVLDDVDAGLAPAIRELGMLCEVMPTIMHCDADRVALARAVHSLVPA